jgi:hypothetical protein
MRRLVPLLCIALSISVATDLVVAAPACGKQAEQTYRRKTDLPPGAAAATGVAMAEKGKAFQKGDVMRPGVPLYRFVSASRSGCRIRIAYERGGFTNATGAFILSYGNGAWKLTGQE